MNDLIGFNTKYGVYPGLIVDIIIMKGEVCSIIARIDEILDQRKEYLGHFISNRFHLTEINYFIYPADRNWRVLSRVDFDWGFKYGTGEIQRLKGKENVIIKARPAKSFDFLKFPLEPIHMVFEYIHASEPGLDATLDGGKAFRKKKIALKSSSFWSFRNVNRELRMPLNMYIGMREVGIGFEDMDRILTCIRSVGSHGRGSACK
jgi:hypothetical protein